MMNKYYIYFHINPVKNEVFYVGKGCNNRAYRKERSKHWKNVANKYGYKVVIVKNNLSEKYAFILEKKYVKIIGRRDLGLGPLVNLTDGGDGKSGFTYTMTQQHKDNISKGNKGKLKSEETKLKISNSLKGNIPGNKGKKATLEQKLKQSIAQTGKKKGPYKKRSKEDCQKQSDSQRGTKIYNNGIVNKKFKINNVPEGFILGKKKIQVPLR